MSHSRRLSLAIFALCSLGAVLFARQIGWASHFPKDWQLPVAKFISRGAAGAIDQLAGTTRLLAALIDWPMKLLMALLAQGQALGVTWMPPLSWAGIVLAVVLLGRRTGGAGLATLLGAGCAYLLFFGQWPSAMLTLASVAIAVPFALLSGLVLGILAWQVPRLDRLFLTPLLDLMQTVPAFAYLVPTLVLFGFGPVAALIATVIFALPPMARVTTLSLSRLPESTIDLAAMMGCSRMQALFRVLLPTAMPMLLVGLNQTVMMSLNMVIIASMIGAGGLGYDVLLALRQLNIGRGLEAGAAIVALAIMLDRQFQALAGGWSQNRAPDGNGHGGFALLLLVIIAGTTALGLWMPALARFPDSWQFSTGGAIDGFVTWINVNFFDPIERFRVFLLRYLMNPIRITLVTAPWAAVVAIVALASWMLGGVRLLLLALLVCGLCLVGGLWTETMITIYLCLTAAIIATLIGVPLGIAGSYWRRFGRALGLLVELLQTMPSFVYLIPVVMLFRVGDVSALIAIVAFAVTAVIRYTMAAFDEVPETLIEAGTSMGCSRGQMLRFVQLPNALPAILLGINQCLLFSLAMVVITALVGTRDLGQQVYIALTRADIGRGLVAGLCLGLVGILIDRLFRAAAARLAPDTTRGPG